jgi:hypothetical protein
VGSWGGSSTRVHRRRSRVHRLESNYIVALNEPCNHRLESDAPRAQRASHPDTLDVILKRWNAACFFICSLSLLAGCGRAEYSAEYNIPDTELTLRIELKQINPPLAEYERALVVIRAGSLLQSVVRTSDIGGYSLLNLYKLPSGEYVLDYDGNPDYRIDPRTGTVHAKLRGIPIGEPDRPLRGTYIGALISTTTMYGSFFRLRCAPNAKLDCLMRRKSNPRLKTDVENARL